MSRTVIILLLMAVLTAGCDRMDNEPIRIGYVGGLTGRAAALGISGRDGTILAVEEANRSGGIHGHRVELVIMDDQQNDEAGRQAVGELIDAGVPAIIGPMSSSMAVVMEPIVNRSNTLMISPTVSSMMLGKKDDNFFRVYPQCNNMGRALAEYAYGEKSLKRFAVIYDLGNRAFTESWKNCFNEHFKTLGGQVVREVSFTTGQGHSFGELIDQALSADPDGVLFLANSLDSAMLAQQVMKRKARIPIFTSEWSMTRDLLHSGGHSVEGVSLFHTFNEASDKQRYLSFKERYRERFRQDPSFPAIHAYDAAQIVLEGLRQGAATGPELKRFILKQRSFKTLQSELVFDDFGDVERDLFLTVVQGGEFVVVRQLPVDVQ